MSRNLWALLVIYHTSAHVSSLQSDVRLPQVGNDARWITMWNDSLHQAGLPGSRRSSDQVAPLSQAGLAGGLPP